MELVKSILQKAKQAPVFLTRSKGQRFYGHGKLLLTGEYFVLDGALALAVPTTVGQSMHVQYNRSYGPKLSWKSYGPSGKIWFESEFEFWHFDCLDKNPTPEALFLQKLLRQARAQNSHFLRDQVDVKVETFLEFPLEWGLGSSSSLIYNVSQWAYVGPFELLFNTGLGSGYDIACAQSGGPILYEKRKSGPLWSLAKFNPSFQDDIFFVYSGQKKKSDEAIEFYRKKGPASPDLVHKVGQLTEDIVEAKTLKEFEYYMKKHEELVGNFLNLPPVREERFADYWGEVKSLGAWGGDFLMATSGGRSAVEARDYFSDLGLKVFLPYKELVLTSGQVL